MDNDYLKKYGDRYWTCRGEDGIWNLTTRIPPRDGLAFDVYAFGDGVLAALLPPQTKLVKDFPGVFEIHQDATDGKVLLFPESELDRLADRLKLRRRRRLSEEAREKAAERLRPFHFKTHVTAASQAKNRRSTPDLSTDPEQHTIAH